MRTFISKTIILLFLIFLSFDGKGQSVFQTIASGNWNAGTTWTKVSGPSTLGYPVGGDDAIIVGIPNLPNPPTPVTINVVNGQYQCKNLLVDVNSANTITIGPLPFHSLTVNGTMTGWDNVGFPNIPSAPNGSSINPFGAGGTLVFTGSAVNGLEAFGITNSEVIAYWNNVNQINVNVSFTTGSTKFIDWLYDPFFATASIDFLKNVTISGTGGKLESGPNSFAGFNITGTLTISSGTTLKTSAYLNSSTFSIASTGTLNTSYTGDQGWWSGSNIPSSFSINDASTIHFSASAAQNIYARQYGNLELSNGTKTQTGAGNMVINGNLTNTGTWNPTEVVTFSGTGTQTINGTGTTFSGGIVIGNVSINTVEINEALITPTIVIKANSTFNPKNNNVTLSGDLTNNGILMAGTGTATTTFNGTTNIVGTINTSFNNVIITGILNSTTSAFNVSGSFTNNGTFNRGTGTVVFNGSGTQNVSGSSPISFHNLTISNLTAATDVVNFNTNVDLYNILTLNANGHIDADGTGSGGITLISGDNGTAKIGPIGSGAVFDGNITTQRRIVPGTAGWRHISTPLRNQTLASWTDDFSVQGVTGGTFPGADPIIHYYDEASGSGATGEDGWKPFTNITDNISKTGIRVYFFPSQLSPTLILDNTGPPNVGDGNDNTVTGSEAYTILVDFHSTAFDGGGWNLIENPYPCEIDYQSVIDGLRLTNVDNAIYIWDPVADNYTSYVAGGGTGKATQYIASGQSFFVKANAVSASVAFTENDKDTNHGNSFVREGIVENSLKIKIKSEDGANFDETIVRFRKGSSEDFEGVYDAYKLAYGKINISTLPKDDLDLSINTLGDVNDVRSIKLRVAAWAFGDFNINFTGLESFTDNVQFRLLDKYLDKTTIVNADSEYTFQILENDPESYGDDRFELQLFQELFILGEVATYSGVPVTEVMINAVGDDIIEKITDISGAYSLETFEQSNYTLSAAKSDNTNLNDAVTTLDIISARRHLLKIDEFESPYQLVAADVNMSKSVTALDLFRMRLVVLGIEQGFKDGINWLFIPETFDLTNDPFSFDTKMDVSLIDENLDLDFVAVKIGDVNNSWIGQAASRQSKGSIELNFEHLMNNNGIIEIPVVAKDFNDISGYQFSISWDPKQLEFYSLENQATEGHFNEKHAKEGILTTMWDEFNGQSTKLDDGSILFVLKFTAKDKNAKCMIELNSSVTEAVAFDRNLNALNIKSNSKLVNLEELRNGNLELSQNIPNPFDFETAIDFKIPKAGKAKLSVINMLGEIVYYHEQDYEQGIYRIKWNKNQGSRSITPGVYIYRLEHNGETVVKKMLIK